MANDLVKKELQAVITDEVLEMYEQLAYYKQQVQMFEHRYKEQLINLLQANGTNSYSDEYVSISYVEPHTAKRIDAEKLKDEGIYEDYLKETEVKGFLRIKLKGANDD